MHRAAVLLRSGLDILTDALTCDPGLLRPGWGHFFAPPVHAGGPLLKQRKERYQRHRGQRPRQRMKHPLAVTCHRRLPGLLIIRSRHAG